MCFGVNFCSTVTLHMCVRLRCTTSTSLTERRTFCSTSSVPNYSNLLPWLIQQRLNFEVERFIEHQSCLPTPLLTPVTETLSDIMGVGRGWCDGWGSPYNTNIRFVAQLQICVQQTITEEIHLMLIQSCCWRLKGLQKRREWMQCRLNSAVNHSFSKDTEFGISISCFNHHN